MGYTHYWTQLRDLTDEEMLDIKEAVDRLRCKALELHGIETVMPIDSDGFYLNGVGDEEYETFVIQTGRIVNEWAPDKLGWDFCKTARRDYDSVVTAALIFLGAKYPDAFGDIQSDGEPGDWMEGLELVRACWPTLSARIPEGV